MSEDSLLDFPCDIPVKVFGRNEPGFREIVLSIMQRHFSDLSDADVAERPSSKSSYLSLTIVVTAQNREQIDAVYQELSAHDDVMMAL